MGTNAHEIGVTGRKDPSVRAGLPELSSELLPEPQTFRDRFNQLADKATAALGSAWALLASILLVVGWAISGPLFGWSDSWQLFINTTTTVITFWMVFVIQNSQNRDARALHLKLDEIIRASEHARNEFIVAEKATEAQISAREEELQEIVEGSVDEAMDEALDQRVPETVEVKVSHAIDRHTSEQVHGIGRPSPEAPSQPSTGTPDSPR